MDTIFSDLRRNNKIVIEDVSSSLIRYLCKLDECEDLQENTTPVKYKQITIASFWKITEKEEFGHT